MRIVNIINIPTFKKLFYSSYEETCQHPRVFVFGLFTGITVFCVSFGYAFLPVVLACLGILYYLAAKKIMGLLKYKKGRNIDRRMK